MTTFHWDPSERPRASRKVTVFQQCFSPQRKSKNLAELDAATCMGQSICAREMCQRHSHLVTSLVFVLAKSSCTVFIECAKP
jgi:hypothetical protein